MIIMITADQIRREQKNYVTNKLSLKYSKEIVAFDELMLGKAKTGDRKLSLSFDNVDDPNVRVLCDCPDFTEFSMLLKYNGYDVTTITIRNNAYETKLIGYEISW